MESIIWKFSDIIRNYEINTYNTDYNKVLFDANIYFKNNSILACKDVLIFNENNSVKRKYSFHWMNSDNDLIIRWDNAHHHQKINTYPNHKHVGEGNTIESANEISLYEVLAYIRQVIKKEI